MITHSDPIRKMRGLRRAAGAYLAFTAAALLTQNLLFASVMLGVQMGVLGIVIAQLSSDLRVLDTQTLSKDGPRL